MEYSSQEELYKYLKGAFKVKMRMIKDSNDNIQMIDIWNYLKLNKWCYDKNLSISEMVNDITQVDIDKVDQFIKEHKKN